MLLVQSNPVAMTSSGVVDRALIQSRIKQVRADVPASVDIVAVSKGFSADHIRMAYEAGLRHFGESKVQEAQHKHLQLQDCPEIIWHLIGHLQTNKIKPALQLFQCIDSVDSLKLAQALDRKAEEQPNPPQICLQVKLAPDPTKYGWDPTELWEHLSDLNALSHLRIRGLMTILPQGLLSHEAIDLFGQCADLADRIQQTSYDNLEIRILSMGMSADYRLAVAAGSTQVRIGQGLFGSR